jgi:hypothetical protein
MSYKKVQNDLKIVCTVFTFIFLLSILTVSHYRHESCHSGFRPNTVTKSSAFVKKTLVMKTETVASVRKTNSQVSPQGYLINVGSYLTP